MNVVAARMYVYRFVRYQRRTQEAPDLLISLLSQQHTGNLEKSPRLLLSQDSTETLLLVSLETTQETN